MRIAAPGESTLLFRKSPASVVERCVDASADRGGGVCQVDAAEQRVGLLSQLLLDMGSIAVDSTVTELCCCVCQAGDTSLAMLGRRAPCFAMSFRADL